MMTTNISTSRQASVGSVHTKAWGLNGILLTQYNPSDVLFFIFFINLMNSLEASDMTMHDLPAGLGADMQRTSYSARLTGS